MRKPVELATDSVRVGLFQCFAELAQNISRVLLCASKALLGSASPDIRGLKK